MSASNAQIYQKDLVQKTMTQLFEYNHHDLRGLYTRPTLDLVWQTKFWGYLTKGMSPEEIEDFTAAKNQLEKYEKIYSIVEYTSALHENITTLERRVMTNNPTMPQNMWRTCRANNQEVLFEEMEQFL